MWTIDRSSAFKRDYKREVKGQHRATLDDALMIFQATGQATVSVTSSPTCC